MWAAAAAAVLALNWHFAVQPGSPRASWTPFVALVLFVAFAVRGVRWLRRSFSSFELTLTEDRLQVSRPDGMDVVELHALPSLEVLTSRHGLHLGQVLVPRGLERFNEVRAHLVGVLGKEPKPADWRWLILAWLGGWLACGLVTSLPFVAVRALLVGLFGCWLYAGVAGLKLSERVLYVSVIAFLMLTPLANLGLYVL